MLMRVKWLWCAAVIVCFICAHFAVIKDSETCAVYPCLIFEEEFHTFDHSTWEHLITKAATGNQEFQYYTNNRSNSFIRGGVLYLKPILTSETYGTDFLTSGFLDLWGSSPSTYCTSNRDNEGCFGKGTKDNLINPIQSAGVRTAKSFSFKYGKMEVRAKVPKGDWVWPAVWLMPKYSAYGEWPASGEIDLLESRGNDELYLDDTKEKHVGNKMVSQSMHWGPYYPENGQPKTLVHILKKEGRYSDDFHLFGLEWKLDRLIFRVDNNVTLNVTMTGKDFWNMGGFSKINKDLHNPWEMGSSLAPFDEEFYIIMNVAVGGTNQYFHDTFYPKPPWKNDGDGKKAMKDFWEAKKDWYKTWQGDQVALKVDYVKVWKLDPTI